MPAVSIVVRAYNEEKHLPTLLRAVARQSVRDHEVLLVDSGSFDRTRSIAADHGARVLRIASRDFTFGYALNVGIRAATAPLVALVSAHTEPVGEDWLANLLAPFDDERTAMVYGRQVGVEVSKFSEFRDFLRTFGTEAEVLAPPKVFANNANSSIRRDLWERHPFDETLPGLEDAEWAKHWMERGRRILYQPDAVIRHIHEESWAQVRRRYYREAVASKAIGARHRRQIAREVAREASWAVSDVKAALRQGQVHRLGEVVRFRWEKAVGTVKGLLDGAAMQNPVERQEYLFERHGRAVVIHGPGKATLEEVEVPRLKPSEVLVKVAWVGICGTDLEILDGSLGYYRSGMASYPITPGHEFSGTVVELGPKVEAMTEGEPVVVECIQGCHECAACRRGNPIACERRAEVGVIGKDGALADYVAVPSVFAHPVPLGLDLRKAALCEPLAVVLKGLRRLGRPGLATSRKCAVVGLGPIGHLAALVLAHRGHPVTVFDRRVERRALLADHPGVRVTEDLAEIEDFQVVVEATGHPDALDRVLEESGAGAEILLLGLPYARREFEFESLVTFDKTVVGSVGSEARDFDDALALLPQLDLTPFLQKALPLEEYRTAWELARQGRYLKVLVRPGGQDAHGEA